MKKDKFKELVSENRDGFELYEHDLDHVWNNISDQLDKRQSKSGKSIVFKIAASIAVIMVAGLFFYSYKMSVNRTTALTFPSELSEAVFYYEGMINSKLELIKASNQQIDQDIFNDLEALDMAYQELKTDLNDNADNQEVIEAMIQNYKIKLEILESILDELEGINQDNTDEDERNHEISL